MKDKIDRIFSDLKNEVITEKEAQKQVLDLFVVSPRYSISLVYVKNIPNGQEIALRSFITDSNSKEEALGKALIYFTDEMKNYNLSNKVVLKHNEG
jgi:hypothetical protein